MSIFSIADIPDLSMRTKNALRRNGVFTIDELRTCLENGEIYNFSDIGNSSIEELKRIASSIDSSSNDRLLISDLFSENRYNIFLKYCNQKGLVYVDELSQVSKTEISTIRGLGVAKIQDICLTLAHIGIEFKTDSVDKNDINGLNISSSNNLTHDYSPLCSDINPELEELKLNILIELGVKKSTITRLQKLNCFLIGDLSNVSSSLASNLVSINEFDSLLSVCNKLKMSLYELFEDYLSKQSTNDDYSIILKRAEGFTLQSIADNSSVTRERIRQRESSFISHLDHFMIPIANRFINEKGFVTVQDIVDIYDNDDYDLILLYWCKHNAYINYISYAELFVKTPVDYINAKLINIANEIIGEGINVEEKKAEILELLLSNNIEFITFDAFINFIKQHGYKVFKTYAIKGHQSYGYLCAKVIAKYFPKGIKLYDSDDLDKLRQKVLEEFGDIGLSDNNRSLSTRIAAFTILSGRGSVIAPENVYVELSMLEDIKEYIDSLPEATVYYSELYAKFQGVITMMSNIDNYNFLHGVLKMYYADEYDFSKRDYLTKRGNYISGKLSDRLNKCIVESGHPLSKDEIKVFFPGLTDIVLFTTTTTNPYFFQWDYHMYSSIQLIKYTEEDLQIIKNTINEELERNLGYCSDATLLMLINNILPSFIIDNGICTAYNLYSLCAKLFGTYFDFRRPHICKKGMLANICFKTIALHLLGNPTVFNLKDYQEISKLNRWSHVTVSSALEDIEQDYVRISEAQYVLKNSFLIESDKIESIKQAIVSKANFGYLSLLNFEDFDSFPEIQYPWNNFLLHSIVSNYITDFKIVESRNKDRRYEKGIIIGSEACVETYTELVTWCLKQEQILEISETKLLSFLVLRDLAFRYIPQELYDENNVLEYKDGFFKVIH